MILHLQSDGNRYCGKMMLSATWGLTRAPRGKKKRNGLGVLGVGPKPSAAASRSALSHRIGTGRVVGLPADQVLRSQQLLRGAK